MNLLYPVATIDKSFFLYNTGKIIEKIIQKRLNHFIEQQKI